MRGFRSTTVLFALFLALGSYAYFIESERPPASESDTSEQAFDIESDNILSLSVSSRGNEATNLSRNGSNEDWEIIAPFSAAVDENAASAIANSLASLEIRRVVEEEAPDLSVFGLSSPTFSVEFTTEGGSSTTLSVGDETPTGSDRYATLDGSARVFLIASFLESTLNRTAFDLRDRSLLEFTGPDVRGLIVEQNDDAIRFAKTDGNWRVVDPIDVRADFGVVDGLVGRIGSGEMVTVELESIADDASLEPYGLAEPRMVVTVETDSGEHLLFVGDENTDGAVYGRDAARSVVFTVDAALVDDLARNANTYREKDLFNFRPFNATAVTVSHNGNTNRFKKSASEGSDTEEELWERVEPNTEAVDSTTMDELLSKLSNLRAESFIQSETVTGLDTPLATVIVMFGNEEEEHVTISRADGMTYAVHGDEPGFAVVNGSDVDAVLDAVSMTTPNVGTP